MAAQGGMISPPGFTTDLAAFNASLNITVGVSCCMAILLAHWMQLKYFQYKTDLQGWRRI